MSTHRRAANRHDPYSQARLQRDAALERGRTVTKGMAAVSVAGVAALGLYLSQALPGHSATSTATTGSAGSANTGSSAQYQTPVAQPPVAQQPVAQQPVAQTPAAPASSGSSFSTPSYTPAPSQYQAPVTSGAS